VTCFENGGIGTEGTMRIRFLAFVGVLTIAVTVARPAPVPAGQTSATGRGDSSSVASIWTPPRTPDGQPDLQGVWLNSSATPLERPKALEGRPLLTEEEVAELQQRADRLFKSGDADLPVGDSLFLTALANPDAFRNPNGANRSSTFMVERTFDRRTSLIVDPPDGRIPALTSQAQQRRAAAAARDRAPAGPEDINNTSRCLTLGVPRIGSGASGDPQYGYHQILQTAGYVVVLMEAFHDARVIPLDGRPHLPRHLRQVSGDSRGRWEGHTLVVDTTNFSGKGAVLGSGENLRVVERFTRVAADAIDYEVTLDDPQTWTKPWTALVRLKRVPNKIYEFACHEGNQDAMRSILATARAAESGVGRR
jgi:hypothetical protein